MLDKFLNKLKLFSGKKRFRNWTVRSLWKINEFTRVSAPKALQTDSRLTIAERLSKQGF